MTDQAPGHVSFEELAAGYVLDMLEAADERRFLDHAGQCPRCQQAVTDYQEVIAALADAAPAAEPQQAAGRADTGARQVTAKRLTARPGSGAAHDPGPSQVARLRRALAASCRASVQGTFLRTPAAVTTYAAVTLVGLWRQTIGPGSGWW